MHVMEQYMTYPAGAIVQDRQAEALLMAIMEMAPAVLEMDPPDYDARANFMWVCSNALNHLIGAGVPQDWATHSIGHELTAFYGLAHAESLAVVFALAALVQARAKAREVTAVWIPRDGSEDAEVFRAHRPHHRGNLSFLP